MKEMQRIVVILALLLFGNSSLLVSAGIRVNVVDFGAKGDGMSDDAPAIQRALDYSRQKGGGTVYFPMGTYVLNSVLFDIPHTGIAAALHMYSNQTLRFAEGAVLKRGAPAVTHMLYTHNEAEATGYEGAENIHIIGGVFDENAPLGNNDTAVNISHARCVRICGTEFRNAWGTWHSIEVNSSTDVEISQCYFHHNSNSEDIQIDAAIGAGNLGQDDNTVCTDIRIRDNRFFSQGHCAIGNHSQAPHHDIHIYHNEFHQKPGDRGYVDFVSQTYDVHLKDNSEFPEEEDSNIQELPAPRQQSSDVLAAPVRDTSWQLIWHDEFNGSGPFDEKLWESERGFERNAEWQWYQPQNTYRDNGLLVLEARLDSIPNPNYQEGSRDWRRNRPYAPYSSGSVNTRKSFSFLYGQLEVRARIPVATGTWPAIWTLGKGHWPECGECDLMEFYQVDHAPTILANAAWAAQPHKDTWDDGIVPYSHFLEKDKEWAEKFHIWLMDWTEEYIRLYLDGELLNEIPLDKTINHDGKNPFHAPHFILLDHAIDTRATPNRDVFPMRYEVDYVRVYQKK